MSTETIGRTHPDVEQGELTSSLKPAYKAKAGPKTRPCVEP